MLARTQKRGCPIARMHRTLSSISDLYVQFTAAIQDFVQHRIASPTDKVARGVPEHFIDLTGVPVPRTTVKATTISIDSRVDQCDYLKRILYTHLVKLEEAWSRDVANERKQPWLLAACLPRLKRGLEQILSKVPSEERIKLPTNDLLQQLHKTNTIPNGMTTAVAMFFNTLKTIYILREQSSYDFSIQKACELSSDFCFLVARTYSLQGLELLEKELDKSENGKVPRLFLSEGPNGLRAIELAPDFANELAPLIHHGRCSNASRPVAGCPAARSILTVNGRRVNTAKHFLEFLTETTTSIIE